MTETPLISILTFFPLLGALVLALAPTRDAGRLRGLAFGISAATLLPIGLIWLSFETASIGGSLQFIERHEWIPTLNVQYFVGVDGLGLLMILLTGIVTPMAILASGNVTRNPRLYFALMLFLQAGLYGAFTALNFFHWFLFWELVLIPAYFLIRNWGGPQCRAAALQFFIFTMVGSIAMLVGFMALYLSAKSFDFIVLAEMGRNGGHATMGIFVCVLLGFAVKVPLMPFHSWLPATYSEAPTPVTMMLTGVMSKMGVYGFVRILLPIFPAQIEAAMTPLLGLALLTIVVSAFAALAQKDLKRMLAYSSVNHLGYCMLAVFAVAVYTPGDVYYAVEKAAALNGVILQMFNHGICAAAIFCFIGYLEERSGGLRGVDDFGGLRKIAPIFCGLMGISLFASLGLPGLNGFVGEFLIFKGVFGLSPWAAALATPGLLITAVFLLKIMQNVFSGPLNEKWADFKDLSVREQLVVVPAVALMFGLGVYPQFFTEMTNGTVMRIVELLGK
jgi:NADH-quinone oxidoreductase subunit M